MAIYNYVHLPCILLPFIVFYVHCIVFYIILLVIAKPFLPPHPPLFSVDCCTWLLDFMSAFL